MADEKQYSIPTRLIYGKAFTEEWDFSHHVVPPMTASTTFRLDSVERGVEGFNQIGRSAELGFADPIYVYNRMAEPNTDMLQHALATSEEGECAVTFSTGMAAVHAAVTLPLTPNSEIISHKIVYGCTFSLFRTWLPRFGMKPHFVDLTDPAAFLPHVNEHTKLVYLESPVNPTIDLVDIAAITSRVKELNAKRPPEQRIYVVVDNTFCTPYGQRPLTLGADFSVHSLTKGLSGFGVDMGGAVVTRNEFFDRLISARKDFGAALSPKAAWQMLVYGLPTLALRVEKQQQNASIIAKYLAQHPAVEMVKYPGLETFPQREIARKQMLNYAGDFAPGYMMYFILKGANGEEALRRGSKMMNFIADNSYTVTLAVSLGQLRTLIEHPGSMTHTAYSAEEQLQRGIHPGGIRLAVGIEDPADLVRDLEQALSIL